ncbi:hypothetical protein NI470_05905 [Acinetobacter lwoffii]|nr:hypothetical protein [Acinetobacter lwoffii]MCO8073045.1 hypothetical protein [Acinetobacter lwoffii]MCO8076141.1 hypothetical protein [Acinetobacter lwoffii]
MRQNEASVRELIRYIALFSAVGGENVGGEEPIGNENLGDDDDFEE